MKICESVSNPYIIGNVSDSIAHVLETIRIARFHVTSIFASVHIFDKELKYVYGSVQVFCSLLIACIKNAIIAVIFFHTCGMVLFPSYLNSQLGHE